MKLVSPRALVSEQRGLLLELPKSVAQQRSSQVQRNSMSFSIGKKDDFTSLRKASH